MSTFNSTKESLKDILGDIKRGKIQLPNFQRDWVWDDERIRALLASVARFFPVGAIMLLRTGGEGITFEPRPIVGQETPKSEEEGEDPPQPDLLILDGQQRLTSLASALGDSAVKTHKNTRSINVHYYIDINEAVNGDIDDAFVPISKDKLRIESSGESIDLTSPEKEYENLYFPCSKIFTSHLWAAGFNRHHRDDADKAEHFNAFIETVITPFVDYQFPIITLKKETTLESICKIFEKVNTGGVPLTVFHLLTAIYAAKRFDLRKDWGEDSDENANGIKQRLETHPLLKEIDSKEFLQAVSLLHAYKKGKSKGASEKAILSLPLEDYRKLAPKIEGGFNSAAKFLRRQGFIHHSDIPFRPQMVLLAVIFSQMENDRSWLEPKNYHPISKWFWCGVFGSGYRGSSQTRLVNDCEAMLAWMDSKYEGTPPPTIEEEQFFSSDINWLKTRRNATYKGLSALITRDAKDFFFNAKIREMEKDDLSTLDIHHIFPKKWCKDNGKDEGDYDYDCIINKTPISSKANRKIGGKAPSAYLPAIQKDGGIESDTVMDEILKSHQIDPGTLRADDFEGFCKARRQSLLDLIASTGVKVVNDDSSD